MRLTKLEYLDTVINTNRRDFVRTEGPWEACRTSFEDL
jgi:hypothetical protein